MFRRLSALFLAAVAPTFAAAQSKWWMDEPVRLLQTNLRETDSTLDPARLVRQVAEFPANTLLIILGGIVAQYPTRVDFHSRSPHLPPGRDLFGEVLREAHGSRLRVVGRFDLSKTQKPVFDAHPEWFFERVNGEPAIYNGLYSACINGGYYREHAPKILAEALDLYEVDGLSTCSATRRPTIAASRWDRVSARPAKRGFVHDMDAPCQRWRMTPTASSWRTRRARWRQ